MKKRIKTYLLIAGVLLATSTVAMATQGSTIQGRSGGGTVYSGHVEGERNRHGCYGATHTYRNSGSERVYAYVQIVDKEGYVLGNGSANTGNDYAYSGTITRGSGKNAFGSCGTASGSGRTFARLY